MEEKNQDSIGPDKADQTETQKDRDFNHHLTSLMGDYMESQKTIKTMKRDMEDLKKEIKKLKRQR